MLRCCGTRSSIDAAQRIRSERQRAFISLLPPPRRDCSRLSPPRRPPKSPLLPPLFLRRFVQSLVDDAVAKGATVLAGGALPSAAAVSGHFYPPTVLSGVTRAMRISQEEVFGPVLCVSVFETDADAVRMANDCPFGLGGNVFSRSRARAERIAAALECGMVAVNDFATTYMAQSLPFGGVKESGFDKFAGIEGLRGCCHTKAVVVDRVPWLMRTDIPPPLQYPVSSSAFPFCAGARRGRVPRRGVAQTRCAPLRCVRARAIELFCAVLF